jgi:hypothetical protein
MAKVAYCVFFVLLFAGCASKPQETIIEEIDFYNVPKNYKPKYIADYMDSLKQKKSYEKSRFYYDKEENAVVEAVLINWKDSRKKMTTKRAWKGGNASSSTFKSYLSRKKMDIAEYRIEQRRKDTAFAEIERVILQIATEYKYDYETAFGIKAKYRNPNIKTATCDGFSNAVIEAFKNHPLINKIEKWTSKTGKHAWNVIILKDSRKIYTDVTWYQTQTSATDNEGYIIETPINKTPSMLTFDIEEFNSYGGAINNITGEILKIHFGWEDAELKN